MKISRCSWSTKGFIRNTRQSTGAPRRRPSSPKFLSSSGLMGCVRGGGIRGGRTMISFQGPRSLETSPEL